MCTDTSLGCMITSRQWFIQAHTKRGHGIITFMFCVLRFGSGSGPIIFSEVTCDEGDNHILRCDAVGFSSLASLCTHDDDVAVVCCKSLNQCLCNENDHLSVCKR